MTSPVPPRSRRSILPIILPILIIIAVAWAALFFLKSSNPKRPATALDIRVGMSLPDLEFARLDQTSGRLSELAGTVTLINFWATWCEACMEEMPSLAKLQETYKDRGLVILGVNLDNNPATAIPVTEKEFNLGFSSFVDRNGALGDAFDVHAIPLTITIDRSRRILEVKAGDRNWMDREYLKKLDGWMDSASQN